MLKQYLTITNLDNLEEKVVGTDPLIKEINYEELEKKMLSNKDKVMLSHDYQFTLFQLISEQPERAIKLLEKVAENQAYESTRKWQFEKAQKGGFYEVEKSKFMLESAFTRDWAEGLTLYWFISADLYCIVKSSPNKALKFFQQGYEKRDRVLQNFIFADGETPSRNELKQKYKLISAALKTRDFSYRGPPKNIELKFVPKEEKLGIPMGVIIEDWPSLAYHLLILEKTHLVETHYIEDKAFLIPREGKADWSKGLYIITHNERLTDKVYKTEKKHPKKEIINKTVGKGKIIRFDLERAKKTLKEWLEAQKNAK